MVVRPRRSSAPTPWSSISGPNRSAPGQSARSGSSRGRASAFSAGNGGQVTNAAAGAHAGLETDMLSLIPRVPSPRYGGPSVFVVPSGNEVYAGDQVNVLTAAWLPRGLRLRLRQPPTLTPPSLPGCGPRRAPSVPGAVASRPSKASPTISSWDSRPSTRSISGVLRSRRRACRGPNRRAGSSRRRIGGASRRAASPSRGAATSRPGPPPEFWWAGGARVTNRVPAWPGSRLGPVLHEGDEPDLLVDLTNADALARPDPLFSSSRGAADSSYENADPTQR